MNAITRRHRAYHFGAVAPLPIQLEVVKEECIGDFCFMCQSIFAASFCSLSKFGMDLLSAYQPSCFPYVSCNSTSQVSFPLSFSPRPSLISEQFVCSTSSGSVLLARLHLRFLEKRSPPALPARARSECASLSSVSQCQNLSIWKQTDNFHVSYVTL